VVLGTVITLDILLIEWLPHWFLTKSFDSSVSSFSPGGFCTKLFWASKSRFLLSEFSSSQKWHNTLVCFLKGKRFSVWTQLCKVDLGTLRSLAKTLNECFPHWVLTKHLISSEKADFLIFPSVFQSARIFITLDIEILKTCFFPSI